MFLKAATAARRLRQSNDRAGSSTSFRSLYFYCNREMSRACNAERAPAGCTPCKESILWKRKWGFINSGGSISSSECGPKYWGTSGENGQTAPPKGGAKKCSRRVSAKICRSSCDNSDRKAVWLVCHHLRETRILGYIKEEILDQALLNNGEKPCVEKSLFICLFHSRFLTSEMIA